MSLIEEALRKQREETERLHPAPTASPAPAPGTPPPLPSLAHTGAQSGAKPGPPSAPSDVPPEKSHRTWRMLAGLGALLLIVVAALIWLMAVGFKLFRAAPAAAPAITAGPLSSTAATQTLVSIRTVENTDTSTVTIVTPVTPPVTPTVEPAVATSPVAAVAARPLPATPSGTGAPTETVAAVTTETLQPHVVWPQITVSGIMGGGRTGRSTALVNGQMASVGDSVESAKIVAIDKRGVTFTYVGETRTLIVGASTE